MLHKKKTSLLADWMRQATWLEQRAAWLVGPNAEFDIAQRVKGNRIRSRNGCQHSTVQRTNLVTLVSSRALGHNIVSTMINKRLRHYWTSKATLLVQEQGSNAIFLSLNWKRNVDDREKELRKMSRTNLKEEQAYLLLLFLISAPLFELLNFIL